MKKKLDFDPNDFVYFVLLSEFINRASTGIVLAYYDAQSGQNVSVNDNRGYTVKYKFTPSHRMVRIPSKRKEEVDAMRNHPDCYGSPNGYYRTIEGKKIQVNAVFKELNEDADADIVVNAAKQRGEALNKAVSLISDEVTANNVALILGIQGTSSARTQANLLSFAERNPQAFLETLNQPDVEARGNVLKAMSMNILNKKGAYYVIEDVVYGVDTEECTLNYIKDEGKRTLLKKRLNIK